MTAMDAMKPTSAVPPSASERPDYPRFTNDTRRAVRDVYWDLLLDKRIGLGDVKDRSKGRAVDIRFVKDAKAGLPLDTACWFFDAKANTTYICVGEEIGVHLSKNAKDFDAYAKAFTRHEGGHDVWTSRDLKGVNEIAVKAGISPREVNLWEDGRIEHLLRQRDKEPLGFNQFEEAPEVGPKAPLTLINSLIWHEGDAAAMEADARRAGINPRWIPIAVDHFERATKATSTEGVIPVAVSYRRAIEDTLRPPGGEPKPGEKGEGEKGEPKPGEKGGGKGDPKPGEKGVGESGEPKPGDGKGATGGKASEKGEPRPGEKGGGEGEGEKGEPKPGEKGGEKGEPKPGEKAGEKGEGEKGEGETGEPKSGGKGEGETGEPKPGEETGEAGESKASEGEGGKGPMTPADLTWDEAPRAEDLATAVAMAGDPSRMAAVIAASQSMEEALGRPVKLTSVDVEADAAFQAEFSSKPFIQTSFSPRDKKVLEDTIDRKEIGHLVATLEGAFRGTEGGRFSEDPSRRFSPGRYLADKEDCWKHRIPEGPKRPHRIMMYVDCSGSMFHPYREGRKLILTFNELARKGKIEGHAVFHKIKHRQTNVQTFKFPVPEASVMSVIPDGSEEGILPAITRTMPLAQKADLVAWLTDANICDAPLNKSVMHGKGIYIYGVYVGSPECSKELASYTDYPVRADSIDQATKFLTAEILRHGRKTDPRKGSHR